LAPRPWRVAYGSGDDVLAVWVPNDIDGQQTWVNDLLR